MSNELSGSVTYKMNGQEARTYTVSVNLSLPAPAEQASGRTRTAKISLEKPDATTPTLPYVEVNGDVVRYVDPKNQTQKEITNQKLADELIGVAASAFENGKIKPINVLSVDEEIASLPKKIESIEKGEAYTLNLALHEEDNPARNSSLGNYTHARQGIRIRLDEPTTGQVDLDVSLTKSGSKENPVRSVFLGSSRVNNPLQIAPCSGKISFYGTKVVAPETALAIEDGVTRAFADKQLSEKEITQLVELRNTLREYIADRKLTKEERAHLGELAANISPTPAQHTQTPSK